MNNLESALYFFGSQCDANKLLLGEWFTESITKLATQGGQSLASSSANGLMVSFVTNDLSLADWVAALANVLKQLEGTTTVRTKSLLLFR